MIVTFTYNDDTISYQLPCRVICDRDFERNNYGVELRNRGSYPVTDRVWTRLFTIHERVALLEMGSITKSVKLTDLGYDSCDSPFTLNVETKS